MKTTLFTLAVAILSHIALAQSFDKAKLDNYFHVLEENDRFMGSVAVSRDGKVIYTKSIGFSDYENKVYADSATKYRIGSISKTFTTVLILKEVEQKKIHLDHTIDKWFPNAKNAGRITIEHLLRHRSGIPNMTSHPDFLTWHTQPKTRDELLSVISASGSDFEPGSKAQYSNSNFVLLTFILEDSFGKPYATLLREHITEPLGLTNTHLGGKIITAEHDSKSYKYSGDWKEEPETDMSIPLGAGAIVSTPVDLVRFSDALFNEQLLTKESLGMMTAIKDQFGMGLFQIPFYDKVGYGHAGGIDGFSSVFSYFSDGNVSYALTSNGSRFNTNDISIAVLSAVYDRPYDIPEFSTYEVTPEELDQYVGVYSSTQIQLKITITKEDKTLIAQASGQPSFALEATAKDKFSFQQAGVVMEFDPQANTMVLKQGGGQFAYTKE